MKFIRKNGRVIPIREQREKAGAKVAGGLAVGAAAGALSADIHRHGANYDNTAHELKRQAFKLRESSPKGFHPDVKPTLRLAAKNRKEGMQLFKNGKRVQQGGAFIGATLIGAGVHQALKDTKIDEGTKATVATATGLGANFAIRSAYAKRMGTGKTWDALKHAARRVASKGFKI